LKNISLLECIQFISEATLFIPYDENSVSG